MGKQDEIKDVIGNLCNTYKVVATLSSLAVRAKEYSVVFAQHKELKKIFADIVDIISEVYPKVVARKVKKLETDDLPEELSSLKIVKTYNEILALQYSYLFSGNLKRDIILNKMSLDFNPNEGIIHFNIANLLYGKKKYNEVIDYCRTVLPLTDSQSIKFLMADAYEKIGEYGESIKLYREYFKNNEGDMGIKHKLNELYRKALK